MGASSSLQGLRDHQGQFCYQFVLPQPGVQPPVTPCRPHTPHRFQQAAFQPNPSPPPKNNIFPLSALGGFAPGPRLRANSRLLPQQSLYSCEEGTFSSPEGLGSSASLAAVAPCRPEDTSCFRSTAICVGSETPYKKLVTATAEGASCPEALAMWPLAPASRLPLGAREVQVKSTLGFGSLLGSSAGLKGKKKGEEEEKTGSFGSMVTWALSTVACVCRELLSRSCHQHPAPGKGQTAQSKGGERWGVQSSKLWGQRLWKLPTSSANVKGRQEYNK